MRWPVLLILTVFLLVLVGCCTVYPNGSTKCAGIYIGTHEKGYYDCNTRVA